MSDFVTNSELAALAIYFCLKHDGIAAQHFSGIYRISRTLESGKSYHLHIVRAEIAPEIMQSYVNFERRHLPHNFDRSRWVVQTSAETDQPITRLRLLRPLTSA